MFKSFSALALFTVLGASVIALSALPPKVKASEASVLAKGDRLHVKAPLLNCAMQVWPHIAASCLRGTEESTKILEARLVTARR
jgi:hypothetical protein